MPGSCFKDGMRNETMKIKTAKICANLKYSFVVLFVVNQTVQFLFRNLFRNASLVYPECPQQAGVKFSPCCLLEFQTERFLCLNTCAPAGGTALWNCGILRGGAWLQEMTSWRMGLESNSPALLLAELFLSLLCDLLKGKQPRRNLLLPGTESLHAFPARTLLFLLNWDLYKAFIPLNHLCYFDFLPFNLVSIPSLQFCWPQIGSKGNGNELESSWRITGDYPQMSKTQCPRSPVKQGYNLHISPSDPDLRLVSSARPSSVGEEPCEIVVLPPTANVSVAPCHKQFVSTLFYHQESGEDVHTH